MIIIKKKEKVIYEDVMGVLFFDGEKLELYKLEVDKFFL